MTGVHQYQAIAQYETQRNIPVYYLLYHPWQIPHAVTSPLTSDHKVTGTCDVGCRVVPAQQLRAALQGQPEGHSPAYRELHHGLAVPFSHDQHRAGWRLEHFVVDLLLECETGYIANGVSMVASTTSSTGELDRYPSLPSRSDDPCTMSDYSYPDQGSPATASDRSPGSCRGLGRSRPDEPGPRGRKPGRLRLR